jgi:hypothetical protein
MLPSQLSLDLIAAQAAAPLIPPRSSKPPQSSRPLSISYEIPEDQFTVGKLYWYAKSCYIIYVLVFQTDSKTILGKGNFGIVYRGEVQGKEVAVKTLLPDVLDAKSIRSMLAEMRVMSELGTHPNIVRLVGVHTRDVEQGE